MKPPEKYILADPTMIRVHERAASVAAGSISVLILGETGSGKEIIAETVHVRSSRRDRPFLRLNCASLSSSLIASELFGHERGSFTGADQAKRGLLEASDGGTIFLDEIGEIPMDMQIKLLRVIENRQITPVGGVKPLPIDVRFISATNRDLEKEIEKGTFRQDFYYRLNGVQVTVPPLRDRPSEIEPMAHHFIARAAREMGRPSVPTIAPEAVRWMLSYRWPGNVRELRNAMERGVLLCKDDILRVEDCRAETPDTLLERAPTAPSDGATLDRRFLALVAGGTMASSQSQEGAAHAEVAAITDALDRCGGNQTRAARELRISRGTLLSRLNEFGFPRPRKRR